MEHDERLPGVTFRLTRGDLLPPADNKKQKALGAVELNAEVNDFDVWKEVLDKLNGMRIYTIENLAEEMVEVAQEKARQLENEMAKKTEELRVERAQLQQQLDFALVEIRELRTTIIQQTKELQRLRQVEGELKDIAGSLGLDD